MQLVRDKK